MSIGIWFWGSGRLGGLGLVLGFRALTVRGLGILGFGIWVCNDGKLGI